MATSCWMCGKTISRLICDFNASTSDQSSPIALAHAVACRLIDHPRNSLVWCGSILCKRQREAVHVVGSQYAVQPISSVADSDSEKLLG